MRLTHFVKSDLPVFLHRCFRCQTWHAFQTVRTILV